MVFFQHKPSTHGVRQTGVLDAFCSTWECVKIIYTLLKCEDTMKCGLSIHTIGNIYIL